MTPDNDLPSTPLSFVVCAAIRHQNGTIICGARHYDPIMRANIRELFHCIPEPHYIDAARDDGWYSCEQGFIDNKGQWLTREQAWAVAERAGQIRYPNVSVPGVLYSENLY